MPVEHSTWSGSSGVTDDLIPAWVDPAYEAEFKATWDDVQRNYENLVMGGMDWLLATLDIVRGLRGLGFDRLLQARASMFSLMLTRTKRAYPNWEIVRLDPLPGYLDGRRPAHYVVTVWEEYWVRRRPGATASDLLPLHVHAPGAQRIFWPKSRPSRDPRCSDEFLRDLRWLAQRPVAQNFRTRAG